MDTARDSGGRVIIIRPLPKLWQVSECGLAGSSAIAPVLPHGWQEVNDERSALQQQSVSQPHSNTGY
ncbi:hypothetical protein JMJ77_0009487 [Colletotrichum scovillei]|uniref:Uncharacterized protein n=1 Tax=Colletotrichum scovillei TaxID=1209932 RepID=A0A9P7QZG6_9PEZI|nr:hypothetical protein JMJ77_0009487 [Colletotrichum scovillei]KAG7052568.1 hypothetical protein JMJ78_0005584 [Colletotrichum scovillei]KAG7064857.1 hypothetical protein JMJ76_0012615 [Colletotrichum scovillei]